MRQHRQGLEEGKRDHSDTEIAVITSRRCIVRLEENYKQYGYLSHLLHDYSLTRTLTYSLTHLGLGGNAMNNSPLQIKQLGHSVQGHDEYQNLIRYNQELQDRIDQLENDIDKFRSRNNNIDLEKVRATLLALTHSLINTYSLTH